MSNPERTVTTTAGLVAAAADAGLADILVAGQPVTLIPEGTKA